MNLDNFCFDFDNNLEIRFLNMGVGYNFENDLG